MFWPYDGCFGNKLQCRKMTKLISTFFSVLVCFTLLGSVKAQNRFFTREGILFFTVNYAGEKLTVSNSNISCTIEKNKINLTSLAGKFRFNNNDLKNKIELSDADTIKIQGASLKGEIAGFDAIDFKINNTYQLVIKGNVVINKIDKKIEFPIELKVLDHVGYLKSQFDLNVNDFILLNEKNNFKTNEKVIIHLDLALNSLH